MQIRKERTTFAADHSHAAVWGFLVLMPMLLATLHVVGLTQPDVGNDTRAISEASK